MYIYIFTRFYARASRALESFTSRFVSLVTLTGAAGFLFEPPCENCIFREGPRCSENSWIRFPGRFEMKRRRPRKWISGGSKIKLPGSQSGLLEVSGGNLGRPGGRQDRSETVSGQLSELSWRLLGPSRGAQGAFWDRLGQEVPGSSREAPVETPGGHFAKLFWRLHWRGSKIDRFCC